MEAPGNFSSKVQNGNDVVLTWKAVPYANNYKVYEIVNGQKVLKNTVTALSATIARVPVGEHTYVVHSVSSRFGESLEGSRLFLTMQEQLMHTADEFYANSVKRQRYHFKMDSVHLRYLIIKFTRLLAENVFCKKR